MDMPHMLAFTIQPGTYSGSGSGFRRWDRPQFNWIFPTQQGG